MATYFLSFIVVVTVFWTVHFKNIIESLGFRTFWYFAYLCFWWQHRRTSMISRGGSRELHESPYLLTLVYNILSPIRVLFPFPLQLTLCSGLLPNLAELVHLWYQLHCTVACDWPPSLTLELDPITHFSTPWNSFCSCEQNKGLRVLDFQDHVWIVETSNIQLWLPRVSSSLHHWVWRRVIQDSLSHPSFLTSSQLEPWSIGESPHLASSPCREGWPTPKIFYFPAGERDGGGDKATWLQAAPSESLIWAQERFPIKWPLEKCKCRPLPSALELILHGIRMLSAT